MLPASCISTKETKTRLSRGARSLNSVTRSNCVQRLPLQFASTLACLCSFFLLGIRFETLPTRVCCRAGREVQVFVLLLRAPVPPGCGLVCLYVRFLSRAGILQSAYLIKRVFFFSFFCVFPRPDSACPAPLLCSERCRIAWKRRVRFRRTKPVFFSVVAGFGQQLAH